MSAETIKNRYTEAIGRRKTAVARVRLTPAAKLSFTVNDRQLENYFPVPELQAIIREPIAVGDPEAKFSITAVIRGGGIHAQAESLAMGIARALSTIDSNLRTPLKHAGHLSRDPRAKERRKFGLKKARKAPQWSKR